MGQRLTNMDAVRGLPEALAAALETVRHLALGQERLDHAQAAQSLLQLGHRLAPEGLHEQGFGLELASYGSHHPYNNRSYDECEDCHLPADGYQGAQIDYYQDGVLDEHVQGLGNGVLNLGHIAAHAGNDIALVLLAEESHGQAQDLVINLYAYVAHHTVPERHHNGQSPEVAGGLEQRHENEHQTEYQERAGFAIKVDEISDFAEKIGP